MHITRFRSSFVALACLLVPAGLARSGTVNWDGVTWDDQYKSVVTGNQNTILTVNGSNQLEVSGIDPTDFSAAHYNTDSAFRASATPWVKASFIDTGDTGIRAGIYIEDETTTSPGAGGWLQFEIAATGSDYHIFYDDYDADKSDDGSINFSTGQSIDTGIARSVGVRTFEVGRRSDGTVDFSIDGTLVASLSASQFNPNYFGDIYLSARGETATYTSYATGTNYVPEPASLIMGAMAMLGLLVFRNVPRLPLRDL